MFFEYPHLLWLLAVPVLMVLHYLYRELTGRNPHMRVSSSVPWKAGGKSVLAFVRHIPFALRAVALLCDDTQEEAIVKAYQHQPEELRRESLKAVHAIGSGRYVDFFVNAYQTTSSVETKTCALTCLYSYSAEGRRAFEFLRNEVINEPNGATLLNQIDSMAILQQMRNF